jgi:hypothetical protein
MSRLQAFPFAGMLLPFMFSEHPNILGGFRESNSEQKRLSEVLLLPVMLRNKELLGARRLHLLLTRALMLQAEG